MKTTRRKTSIPARPKAAVTRRVTLPTATAFAKLPLAKRTAIFAHWLARQPKRKTYDYHDAANCALGTFARALYRSPLARGSAWTIGPRKGRYQSYETDSVQVMDADAPASAICNAGSEDQTFGAASRAFNAVLKLSASADREAEG